MHRPTSTVYESLFLENIKTFLKIMYTFYPTLKRIYPILL